MHLHHTQKYLQKKKQFVTNKMDTDGGGSSSNEQYSSAEAKRKGKRICHRHTPQQIQKLEA